MFWSHFFKKNQIVFVPKSSIGGFSGFSDLDRRSQGVPRRFFADLLTFSGKKVKIFKKLHPSLRPLRPLGGGKLVSATIHLQGKRFENVAQGFRVEDTVDSLQAIERISNARE